ncbi:MAG: triose-phosphate isomerase [bacterium]
MRRPIIAGNWKMNKALAEAETLALGIVEKFKETNVDIILCPPFTALQKVGEICKGSPIFLGAQDLFYEENGPWTGEISASQLIDIGCKYVIIGHSERRQIFKEDDIIINKKIKQALKHNLSPIFCVGETEKQRKEGREKEIVERQIRLGLKDIDLTFRILNSKFRIPLVIAYEPVWAIGTGNTCKSEDAEKMHIFIRNLISELYTKDLGDVMRILYGGSVKPDNIDAIMKMPNIDGCLVGGCSLDVSSFCRIIEFR